MFLFYLIKVLFVSNYLECLSYVILDSGTRKSTYDTEEETCDRYLLSPGWFRFQGDAGTRMATTCVPTNKCGTESTGWLEDNHPTVADGKVNRKVCFGDHGNCCRNSIFIPVRNCGSFYVYYLLSPPVCDLGYCSTD